MARLLWICSAGAVGTGARYLLSTWLLRTAGDGFPYGTLAVNLIGSFLLAAILQLAFLTGSVPPTLRLALTTGLMGGFTTYSSFNAETLRYLELGAWALGSLYVAVTLLGCLAAGGLGLLTGRLLAGLATA